MALCRTARATLALLSPILIAACVSDPGPSAFNDKPASASLTAGAPAIAIAPDKPQPGRATYNCADGGMMTIENLGSSVRVLGPDGVDEELPASPANQNSRFGANHDAIVIDGREALVMKAGATPITCTR
ncbi:hypothetical protein [Mesorhizobium sp. SP-1A]|uniref:hypothetical protein n=1 Tax=Mesorhizobium sp. SP-1A TaxID=3077840 RepID=UPI0028F6CC49|nr:hypothetical protein [Mesorhizobium sp. SP-1A]